MNTEKTNATRRLTTMAVMAALSIVLVALIHFPIFPVVSFLEYDPADIPILICGFAFGPVGGLLVTAVAALVQGLTVSAHSGFYGILMHLLSTGTYVLVSSLLYRGHKTKKGAALSIVIGVLASALVMFGANLVVTPYFMLGAVNKDTVAIVLGLMPYIMAFNVIKAGVNGVITFLLYKRTSNLFHKLGAK
ncbi:MAG: ECF transporter S component [Firmicutes bacterium]|nr:ECF transporter S component [Bacillota bacterium]